MVFASKVFFLPSLMLISMQRMWVARLTQFADKWSFFWQSYRLEELINKLLTKWNLSQAFLIPFTLCLYLWWSLYLLWRVFRLIYVFPNVSSIDEKPLGKRSFLCRFFGIVNKKVLIFGDWRFVLLNVLRVYIFISYWDFLI